LHNVRIPEAFGYRPEHNVALAENFSRCMEK